MLLGSAYGKVEIDSSGVTKGVDSATKSMANLQKAGTLIGDALQKVGTAMTIGLTLPIVAFGVASVKSAMEAESALADLKQTIISTGGVAGKTADELAKQAAALQKITKFSDETIVKGQAMLLTFTNIRGDVFDEATVAMLNMGEKFGSVEQASIQLGKALNDPINGVGALRRVGVSLSEEQEKQIKHFVEMNDVASAQKIILKELEVEFGGLAEAAGKTPEGQWVIFLNQLDELKETVGKILLPILIDFIKHLTAIIEKFNNLSPGVQKAIVVFAGLVAVLGPVIAFVGWLVSLASSVAGFITTLSGLGITVSSVSAALGTFGTVITGTLLPALGALLVELLPIILTVAAVAGVIYLLYLAWKKNLFGIQDLVHKSVEGYKQTWARFTSWWEKNSKEAGKRVSQTLLTQLAGGFGARIPGIISALNKIRKGTIKLYEDGSGALLDLATAFGFPEQAMQQFLARVFLILQAINNIRSGAIKLYEDGSGALLDLATAFGFPEQAIQSLLARVFLILQAINNIRSGAIKLYEDGSGALLDLATAFGLPEQEMQNLFSKIWMVIQAVNNLRKGAIKLYEDGSGALLDLAVAFGLPEEAAQEFLANLYSVIDKFRDIIAPFQQAWLSFLNFLKTALARAREYIATAFTNVNWSQIGKYIIIGLANGMLLGIPSLLIAAKKAAESVLAQIKKSLGIASDSKEAIKLGIFTGHGFARGVQMGMDPDMIARAIAKPVTNNTSTQQNITMQFASGLTTREVQNMIAVNQEQFMNTIIGALQQG